MLQSTFELRHDTMPILHTHWLCTWIPVFDSIQFLMSSTGQLLGKILIWVGTERAGATRRQIAKNFIILLECSTKLCLYSLVTQRFIQIQMKSHLVWKLLCEWCSMFKCREALSSICWTNLDKIRTKKHVWW